MARKPSHHRIKSNQTYTIEELAEVVGVCVGTVRNWIRKEKLPCIDNQRPYLILGAHAKEFLSARKSKKSKPLNPGEFFCFTCQEARRAAGAMADFEPRTQTSGRLKALCEACETVCYRSIRMADLPALTAILDISDRAA